MRFFQIFLIFILTSYLLSQDSSAEYNKALELYKTNSYIKSIEVLRVLFEKESPSYPLHYLAGHNYWKMGNTDVTIQHFLACIRFKPEDSKAYKDLIKVYVESEKMKEAYELSNRAYLKFSDDIELGLLRISLLIKAKKHEQALSIVEKLKVESKDYRILEMEARIYYVQGKYDSSETILNWAITDSPKNANLKNNLALVYEKLVQVYQKSGNTQKAKEYLDKAKKEIDKAVDLDKTNKTFLNNQKRIQSIYAEST